MIAGADAAQKVSRILPIRDWLPSYDRRRLAVRIFGDGVVAAQAVPQGRSPALATGRSLAVRGPMALVVTYVVLGTSLANSSSALCRCHGGTGRRTTRGDVPR